MKGESKGVRVAYLKKQNNNKIMQSSSVMPGFLEINVLIIKKKKKEILQGSQQMALGCLNRRKCCVFALRGWID